MTPSRADFARALHANAQISRSAIFGESEEKYRPLNYPEDAATMFAGYVGSGYTQGGVVFLGINPGGGGDSYQRHLDDDRLYSLLRAFRDSTPQSALSGFEAINEAFPSIVQNWNLWRIFQPTLDAFGIDLSQACYLNAVPYRTRENKKPPVSAHRLSWRELIVPTLDVLKPSVIVSLGKAVGGIVERFNDSDIKNHVVPRTIGDSYVSADAVEVLTNIRSERGTLTTAAPRRAARTMRDAEPQGKDPAVNSPPTVRAQRSGTNAATRQAARVMRDIESQGKAPAVPPPPTIRARRSVLFMPGSNQRAIEKAKGLAADSLVLDLEDAVAPQAKAEARKQVVKAVRAGGFGRREIIVRVNGMDTEWGRDDLTAVANTPLDGVLLPKVETPQDIQHAVEILDAAGGPPNLPLWFMAETPRGILGAESIAASSPRLTCLVVGTADLAKDLRIVKTPDRSPLLTSLSLCVLVARAHGLDVLDGVHELLNDEAGFAAACRQGRELGFDGKTLIHPRQVEYANRAFSPSEEEIGAAKEIVDTWEAAHAAGHGVTVVRGRLAEKLHAEQARRILELAAAIAALSEDVAG